MQGDKKKDSKIVFVVQHMENYLFQWCLSQYMAMKNYLQAFSARLMITNARTFYQYDGQHIEQNKKNIKLLEECFAVDTQKYFLVRDSLQQNPSIISGKICMLDMRGQKQLRHDEEWQYVIFGGILGDHPPRDRPAPLRKHFVQIRHLGEMQLATDTAVLVGRLILYNKLQLNSIPMIKAPVIKGLNKKGQKSVIQMDGFSYISRQLDIQTGKIRQGVSNKEKKQIYMSEGVRNLLLKQDLDQQLLM